MLWKTGRDWGGYLERDRDVHGKCGLDDNLECALRPCWTATEADALERVATDDSHPDGG